jgi:hypothetical protein
MDEDQFRRQKAGATYQYHSLRRRPESSTLRRYWIPAFAGMTAMVDPGLRRDGVRVQKAGGRKQETGASI